MFKMNVPGAEGMVCNFDITQQGAEKVTLHRFLMAAAATLFFDGKSFKENVRPSHFDISNEYVSETFFSRLPE